MPVDRIEYLGRYLDAVDRVTAGRPGSIIEDRWLVNNYSADVLPLLDKYLDVDDDRVKAETVMLFCDVRERAVMSKVRDMSKTGSEKVRMACLGYLTTLQEDDDLIPQLFDILDHSTGLEFHRAAVRMAAIAREEDLPHVRKIYGQVNGEMRSDMKVVLDRIISRNPDLVPKRDLILSIPVYPDEMAFDRFLDSSIEYLDVRYRKNVLPNESVSLGTFNNVARALNKMRTRLYNEADNLQYYGPDKVDRFTELQKLMSWANSDLSTKKVIGADRRQSRVCPKCGGMLVSYKGIWMCPDCGGL